jgi:hypothetical protein
MAELIPSGGGGGTTTPTLMTANLTIAQNTQMLFRYPITVGSFQIIAGSDAVLVGV